MESGMTAIALLIVATGAAIQGDIYLAGFCVVGAVVVFIVGRLVWRA